MPPRPVPMPSPDFRTLFESAPGLYLVLATDFTIAAASDAYLHATMTRREAIVGRGLFEVFPDNPDDPAATGVANLRASLERVLTLGVPDAMAVQKYDIPQPDASGGGFEERYWSPVNSPVFGKDGGIAYIIHRVEDVTEFVRLKQQGRQQHELTEALRTHAGRMESEIYRRAQEIQEANRRLRDLQAVLEERVRQRTAELEETNRRLRSEMDERARTDEALRDSEVRYRRLFLHNPHPMWVCDRHSLRFLAVNDAAVQLYGYTVSEFMSMTVKDLIPLEDADPQLRHLVEGEGGPDRPREWRQRRQNGSEMIVEIAAHALNFDGRDAILVQTNDVTERKQLEAQLRQSQKMEGIGLLAGGVAHDFNNLLTAIMGYSQLLRHRLADNSPAMRDLTEVLKAAERAATLTRQLLAFSRQQVLEPRVLDLNAVITDLDKLLRRLIGEDIDLLTAPGPELGRVKADPGQVEQVILNLVVNARDAMSAGGKLTIETANVDLDEGDAQRHHQLRAGRHVMLAVSDTGCGMNPEVASHAFEPFFTTKEMGRGTGLGLSTVHGIVKQSGGHIELYTEVGRGTTFKVFLPRVDEAESQADSSRLPAEVPSGVETVLVVDDEAAIRDVVARSLVPHGYRVLEASDGSEAIALCERRDLPIDLLVTDVVMPLMSGPELVLRATRARPDLRVLFISGYTDRALVHQGLRQPGTAFLQKPFTPDVLVRRVREILDEPRRGAA